MLSWLAVWCSGLLHINAAYKGPRWQFYLFKPLTIALMMLIVVTGGEANTYAYLVLAGLLFSLFGDVFLMLPKDRFIPGLLSFLVAHIFYSVAFWLQFDGTMVWWLPSLLGAASVIIFLLLLPNLGPLLVPVGVYIAVIAQMAWGAGEFWMNTHSQMAAYAFGGALLFMVSDTVLAFERFKGPFRASVVLVMSTYFCAQGLITLSAISG
ncbi:lysoplasmalogenase [Enterovibrio makurazakiensis]|uniref:Lysoplasmalogenase n=1 Tax=Enterovibrio gelatinilyticus TaxID=2899819 RepID=A0ABT5QZS9_9GAMM|nr:lysoplasmalogenase [Enterovibrio sp. ZSDZ42]MDD1793494.1 lysoplasmalogenase [Enterovibrio sp. ZSDZ42]